MKLMLLTKRHRWERTSCDVCGRRNHCAPFVTSAPTAGEQRRIDICAPCLREAVKVATEGRKPVSR